MRKEAMPAVLLRNQADRAKTRCSAATSILAVTKDHERHRVTPQIAPIDRAGGLSQSFSGHDLEGRWALANVRFRNHRWKFGRPRSQPTTKSYVEWPSHAAPIPVGKSLRQAPQT